MAEEIERKFLVPDAVVVPESGGGQRLRQGYVAIDGTVTVRLRLGDGPPRLTVKAGSGLTRIEVEVAVSDTDADALWPTTAGRRIDKTRHRLPLGHGAIAELDVYEGELAGLRTVEVEFPDAATAEAFVAPPWFGQELTGRPGWSNAELALRGIPSRA